MKLELVVSRALAVVAALLLAAAMATAEPAGGPPAEPPPWTPPDERLESHLRELGLDDAQLGEIRTELANAKSARVEIDARLMTAFDEMRALLDQETPDEAAVMKQADRIGAIRTEGRKLMLRTLLRVRADLTPAQRTRLNELMRRDGPPGKPGMFRHGPGAKPGER
jgi:Spy/CpxP family protein refolding chaperone